jgi:hypothetical protein
MDARTLLEAMTLWEGTGTAVAQAAQAVSGLLADNGIGNLIAGGLAVQLHGYPRTTIDVDIIVPDVQQAHSFLVAMATALRFVNHWQSFTKTGACALAFCPLASA